MRLKKITNAHIQNYLGERGIMPVYEDYESAWYKPTQKFYKVMDLYTIEFQCVPNKK